MKYNILNISKKKPKRLAFRFDVNRIELKKSSIA
jgi:hypothetical protein